MVWKVLNNLFAQEMKVVTTEASVLILIKRYTYGIIVFLSLRPLVML